RRRHTRSKRDWSSDVYSSDLVLFNSMCSRRFRGLSGNRPCHQDARHDTIGRTVKPNLAEGRDTKMMSQTDAQLHMAVDTGGTSRSEERRVGKEGEEWKQGE